MDPIQPTPTQFRLTGFACMTTFLPGIIYLIITTLGFLSLNTPEDQIRDPYFTMMELMILLIAPLAAISLIGIHSISAPNKKIFSIISVFFIFLTVGISSCVHFTILALGNQPEITDLSEFEMLLSFKWPSVVYAMDILAWDWFFAISILFLVPTFGSTRIEKQIKLMIAVCGTLCLAGLAGVPLNNMQVRNIGIIGYGVLAPFIFLLVAFKIKKNVRTS